MPPVRVQLGFTADAFPAKTAGQVAVDSTAIASQHLQLDAVRAKPAERPSQHQPGHLTAKPPAAQNRYEQAHCVGRAVLIGVLPKTGTADAAAVVFDRPGIGARLE